MAADRRWTTLPDPLRGAAYLVGLGLLIALAGALVAGLFVWIMT